MILNVANFNGSNGEDLFFAEETACVIEAIKKKILISDCSRIKPQNLFVTVINKNTKLDMQWKA